MSEYTYVHPNPHAGTLTVERFCVFCTPDFKALPLRQRIAWRLRALATWIEGGKSITHVFRGRFPLYAGPEDWNDAISYGAAAIQTYLADLSQERAPRRRS